MTESSSTRGFAFVNRRPRGTPAGGQFAAGTRAEPGLTLRADPDSDPHGDLDETWTVAGGLAVGQWAEGEHTRVRLVEEQTAEPEPGTAAGATPAPDPTEPTEPTGAPAEPEPTLVMDIQVRADHPDAGEPDPIDPEWATPRSAPAEPVRVPSRYSSTPSGRRTFSAFATRQFDNLMGDLGAAWGEFGEAMEMAAPQIR